MPANNRKQSDVKAVKEHNESIPLDRKHETKKKKVKADKVNSNGIIKGIKNKWKQQAEVNQQFSGMFGWFMQFVFALCLFLNVGAIILFTALAKFYNPLYAVGTVGFVFSAFYSFLLVKRFGFPRLNPIQAIDTLMIPEYKEYYKKQTGRSWESDHKKKQKN